MHAALVPRVALGFAGWLVLALPCAEGAFGHPLTASSIEAPGTNGEVGVALVLAIDVSRSVSEEEYHLQIQGYARAFRSQRISAAIRDVPTGIITVTILEWSDSSDVRQVVGWSLVYDDASAEKFAGQVEAIPYQPGVNTSVGGAIAQATNLLDSTGYRPLRRVIDISGDGESTDGPLLAAARAAAIGKQITINGLPVCTGGNLSLVDYYRDSVIGGVGAFLVMALGYDNFGEAILNKLVVEIAGRSIPERARVVRN